ncbi:hypothetical protein LDENG_00049550 [Lucifuga dentata]|nr:hypothetical protein LDENG_00049550 [Lucifuga dentata]
MEFHYAHPALLSANHNQSQGCRGEVSEESQHLIGDGLTDWMTEEVDFSSYLPNPPSPPSSTNASLPPSPLQNDIQVPSDLEVMTSLLQEELAQLEDYFLSEPLPEKGSKLGKCDRGPLPVGPQPFSQLPYASYSTSNQSESSPLLVTLATGELDLLSICGGPIGRSKIPRHAPYSCSRPNGCGRKRVSDGLRFTEGYDHSLLSSKGNNSGNPAVTLTGNYGCVEEEQLIGKSYCLGSAVEVRRCSILQKEEKNCCFSQDIIGGSKVVSGGFGFGGPLDVSHKKEDLLMYSMREVSGGSGNNVVLNGIKPGVEVTKATVSWKNDISEGCYLPVTPQAEAYHSFLGNINDQVKTESLQIGQHDLHCNFLEDQGPECLLMNSESLNLESVGRRQACRLKEEHCPVTYNVDVIPGEGGERKQKKRDQNKTAAHRYRQRKRAELDSLEEQLHCLEGRNRELRDKAESVEREIQYVKDLLIEVYKARSQRLKQDTRA